MTISEKTQHIHIFVVKVEFFGDKLYHRLEVLKARIAQIARGPHMPGFVRYGHIIYCYDK